jgi:hypothetical protein
MVQSVVVASEVVVRGGDKKSALKEAKPQKPVLEKVGVRAFAQAVDARPSTPYTR